MNYIGKFCLCREETGNKTISHIDIYRYDEYNRGDLIYGARCSERMDEKRIAMIFKAFCDENRIKIIKRLRSGEKCACKLLEEIDVSQPTLSHHMKILCDAGIVNGRKEGKWMHYSISAEGIKQAECCLHLLTAPQPEENGKSCCGK